MRRFVGMVALAALAIILTGCGATNENSGKPTIVTTLYPLTFITEHVAGEHANVENLASLGVEPHDLELTGKHVGQIADADFVIYLEGFQPAVDEAVAQNAADTSLNVSEELDLLPEELSEHSEENGEHEEQHADDHEEHDHGDLEGDPHIWLDPANMRQITHGIAEHLADIDPDNAETYRENAETLIAKLEDVDKEYQEGLAACERHVFVVAHEAFGYLADRYGLEQVGIAGLDPESEPSAARLAEAQRVIQDEKVTTVFYERLVSPKVTETLARDLNVSTAVLDPIEGLTEETQDEDYLSLMRANLQALRTANGCS